MPKLKEGTKTLADLKKEAQSLKIKGRSKMNKKELMAAVDEAKDVDEKMTKDVPKDVSETTERVKRDESPSRIDKELKKTSKGKAPKMREVKKDDDKDSMEELRKKRKKK